MTVLLLLEGLAGGLVLIDGDCVELKRLGERRAAPTSGLSVC